MENVEDEIRFQMFLFYKCIKDCAFKSKRCSVIETWIKQQTLSYTLWTRSIGTGNCGVEGENQSTC